MHMHAFFIRFCKGQGNSNIQPGRPPPHTHTQEVLLGLLFQVEWGEITKHNIVRVWIGIEILHLYSQVTIP